MEKSIESKVYEGFGKKYKTQNADKGFNIKGLIIKKKPFDMQIFESARGLISSISCDGNDFACSVGKWKPTAPEGFAKVKGDDLELNVSGFVMSVDTAGVHIQKA